MDLTVGTIVEGSVKSITKFGAFIALPDGRTGMVHISEIAHVYVNDIREHLTEGQTVKVMVIAQDPEGRINLSIKRTQQRPPRPMGDRRGRPQQSARPRGEPQRAAGPKEPQSFDDMVKQFMQDSDSKISSVKRYSEHRSKTRRR